MSVELKYFIDKFDELMKARRASVGEIRIYSNGVKYQKQPDGSWKPVKGQEGEFRSFRSETDFGKDFKQFKGYPKEAILYLAEVKEGQVKEVWEREDVGSIDLIWGGRNQGLRHIIKKHLGKDFSSYKDMAEKIDTILRKGKLSKDKNDYILTYGDYKVVLLDITVYDENDNFNDKRFILTSYNHVVSKEDKKSSSSKLQSNSVEVRETTLKKSLDHTTPDDSVLQHGLDLFRYKTSPVSIDSFYKEESGRSCSSQPKDTSYSLNEQQFMDEIIEKAKKGSPIGTEKTWGGKVYIKTDKGWKPKGKGTKKVNEEDSTSKHSSIETLTKQAASATDEQLKAAINDPEANSELKKVAQEELNKRNKQQDSDDKSNKQFTIEDAYKNLLEAQEKGELELSQDVLDEIQKKLQESKKKKESEEETIDNKLDKLKQEITSEIDKKLSDMTGFKKITQTYVKKDGKTVVIKMKGDNQYKATSPGFKLESKPYESLTDFKKRIKEELDKQSTKTEKKEVEEKQELSFAEGKEFETDKQFYKWNEERSQLSNLYNEENVKRMESEANEYLSKGNLNLSLKSSIYGAIDKYDFNEVLEKYGSCNDEEKKAG